MQPWSQLGIPKSELSCASNTSREPPRPRLIPGRTHRAQCDLAWTSPTFFAPPSCFPMFPSHWLSLCLEHSARGPRVVTPQIRAPPPCLLLTSWERLSSLT